MKARLLLALRILRGDYTLSHTGNTVYLSTGRAVERNAIRVTDNRVTNSGSGGIRLK